MLRTGLIGTAVVALCCFTPVLVILLAMVGLSALVGWLDFRSAAGSGGLRRDHDLRALEKETDDMTDLQSTLTCPRCGHNETETMPTDACQFFYDCKGCGAVLRPHEGDCCVYCSYGSVPCPPIQETRQTGPSGNCCAASMVGA